MPFASRKRSGKPDSPSMASYMDSPASSSAPNFFDHRQAAAPWTAAEAAGSQSPGLTSKLLAFPWRKSSTSPRLISQPFPSPPAVYQSPSLPHGFPLPPLKSAPPARPHPPNMMENSGSMTSTALSSMDSSSSFASTSAFSDEWDSDTATTRSTLSSPETSPRRTSTGKLHMWNVRGLRLEETEELVDGAPVLPAKMAPPMSPPATKGKGHARRDTADDADNEFSPKGKKLVSRRAKNKSVSSSQSSGSKKENVNPDVNYLFPSEHIYTSKTRIPSMRFEGISMEAVFAEVERNLNEQRSVPLQEAGRSQSLDSYAPKKDLAQESVPAPAAPHSPRLGLGPRPAIRRHNSEGIPCVALPKRSSSRRPPPINIEAAQSLNNRSGYVEVLHESVFSPSTVHSPATASPSCYSPTIAPSPVSPVSPMSPMSPPLSGAFSTSPTSARSNKSLSALQSQCGTPRMASSPTPSFVVFASPALSTTSTMRGVELPEVNVSPPTPTLSDAADFPSPRSPPISPTAAQQQAKVAIVSNSRVTVIESRRTVKMSTRPSTNRRRTLERMNVSCAAADTAAPPTPPLSPARSNLSTPSPPLQSPTWPLVHRSLTQPSSPTKAMKRASVASVTSVIDPEGQAFQLMLEPVETEEPEELLPVAVLPVAAIDKEAVAVLQAEPEVPVRRGSQDSAHSVTLAYDGTTSTRSSQSRLSMMFEHEDNDRCDVEEEAPSPPPRSVSLQQVSGIRSARLSRDNSIDSFHASEHGSSDSAHLDEYDMSSAMPEPEAGGLLEFSTQFRSIASLESEAFEKESLSDFRGHRLRGDVISLDSLGSLAASASSDSIASQASTDSEDSLGSLEDVDEEEDVDNVVVMMGTRVSCGYEVGVAM